MTSALPIDVAMRNARLLGAALGAASTLGNVAGDSESRARAAAQRA
jgi:hypothetical protein